MPAPTTPPVRRRRSLLDERGGSETIGVLLLTPVMMLALLGSIQAGVWFHGRQTALAAVQAAAEAESVLQPAGGAGQAAATSIAQQGGLTGTQVSVSRGATQVTVTMTARVPMFIDIGVGSFTETATAPRERVTP